MQIHSPPCTNGPRIVGWTVLAAFLLFFAGWGAVAPLPNTVIASGVVAPITPISVVQHLDGGVAVAVLVANGDLVEAGTLLLEFDSADFQEELSRASRSLVAATLALERNTALLERREFAIPTDELAQLAGRSFFEAAMRAEVLRLVEERALRLAKADAIKEKINRLTGVLASLRQQITAQKQLVTQLTDRLGDVQSLWAAGAVTKPELQAAQRRLTQQIVTLAGLGVTARRTQLDLSLARQDAQANAAAENAALHAEVSKLQARIDQDGTLVSRLHLRVVRARVTADASGVVEGLAIQTAGAVIAPGQDILKIVPADGQFRIELEIRPADIDRVFVGLVAKINLPSLPPRRAVGMTATISYVAETPSHRERDGRPYFIAHAEFPGLENGSGANDLGLKAGMPAEAFVVGGYETLFAKLTAPLRDALRHGLNEG